jgi:hypothetical protein
MNDVRTHIVVCCYRGRAGTYLSAVGGELMCFCFYVDFHKIYVCHPSSSPSAVQPWVGSGLLLRFRNNIFFYGVRLLASRPIPNLESQVILFCLGHHP